MDLQKSQNFWYLLYMRKEIVKQIIIGQAQVYYK